MQSVASGMKIALSRDVRELEDNDNHSVASISQCGGQTMNQHHQLYTPQDSALVFIDHQPQRTFGVANIDRATLINNVTPLAKVAKE
jgi:hypothetical protein